MINVLILPICSKLLNFLWIIIIRSLDTYFILYNGRTCIKHHIFLLDSFEQKSFLQKNICNKIFSFLVQIHFTTIIDELKFKKYSFLINLILFLLKNFPEILFFKLNFIYHKKHIASFKLAEELYNKHEDV